MKILNQIWLVLCEMVRQVVELPQTVVKAMRHREHQAEVDAQEAERLDRIRNPSKYRGR